MDKIRESQANEIRAADLHRLNNFNHPVHSCAGVEPSQAVMRGHFSYQAYKGGLSIHSNCAEELQNISHSTELPSCLSFNIVFEGRVAFSLGGTRHTMGSPAGVECSALILPESQLLTRHMQAGMNVCKVNVFAERSWLEAHCQCPADWEQLAAVFHYKSVVKRWRASARLIKQAKKLLTPAFTHALTGNLKKEHLAIGLLASCIEELLVELNGVNAVKAAKAEGFRVPLVSLSGDKLKKQIDAHLKSPCSLGEIANALGVSVSTLQRKFKAAYGTTVVDYIRQRRLELAKSALILDGLSIGEAAYLAGYNHPSNFVAAFKKRFLVTPAAFLEQHRQPRL